jgi:hypothetical protein
VVLPTCRVECTSAHGVCAVNVPFVQNWRSTFSHFCNLSETFRASLFGGKSLILLIEPRAERFPLF